MTLRVGRSAERRKKRSGLCAPYRNSQSSPTYGRVHTNAYSRGTAATRAASARRDGAAMRRAYYKRTVPRFRVDTVNNETSVASHLVRPIEVDGDAAEFRSGEIGAAVAVEVADGEAKRIRDRANREGCRERAVAASAQQPHLSVEIV